MQWSHQSRREHRRVRVSVRPLAGEVAGCRVLSSTYDSSANRVARRGRGEPARVETYFIVPSSSPSAKRDERDPEEAISPPPYPTRGNRWDRPTQIFQGYNAATGMRRRNWSKRARHTCSWGR